MLVNAKEILNNARDKKIAVPHFNINNLEWTKYILEECNRLNNPVILGVSEGAAKYMGGYDVVYNLVAGLIKDLNITIPVVLHLDHGSSLEACKIAIDAGFTSVMIDKSKLPLQENILITNQVIAYAKPKNVSVEAEIGCVGGTEDGKTIELSYASLEDCTAFVSATGVDFLAPALGSVHGFYKGEPKLNFERMMQINETCKIPLVLHGGTGIPYEMIEKAIKCGIAKVNINTELQYVWSLAVRNFLETNKEVYDPRKIIGSGEKAIKSKVEELIKVFN